MGNFKLMNLFKKLYDLEPLRPLIMSFRTIVHRSLKKSLLHFRFDDIILTAANRPERQIILGLSRILKKIPDGNRGWG
jgi:hypothetical protein